MLHINDSCYYITKALLLGVLVSDNRMEFMMGGFDAFVEQLPAIRRRRVEKKLFVEADPRSAEPAAALLP